MSRSKKGNIHFLLADRLTHSVRLARTFIAVPPGQVIVIIVLLATPKYVASSYAVNTGSL